MLAGRIDEAGRGGLRGWVHDPSFPNQPVALLVMADDTLLERVVANRHRPDLEHAGFGNGRFAFEVRFSPPLLPSRSWLVRVCAEADGQEIPGSPVRIGRSSDFGEQAQVAFAAAVLNAATGDELQERMRFLAHLRDSLAQARADLLSPGGTAGLPARRALVLDDSGLPEPDRDGGSGALVSHMRSLARLGYEVTVAAPEMTESPAASRLQAEGFAVCHAPWFNSVEEVLRRNEGRFDLVYLHRVGTMASYATLVRRYQPASRLVYSVADLHHLRLARQAAAERRPELLEEARRVQQQEIWAARMADAVITHSPVEAAVLRRDVPGVGVHVMAWSAPVRPPVAGFAERSGLAFIGNFLHRPNLAAALHLRKAIVPAIRAAEPEIVCKLVGSDMPAVLQTPQPGIEVVGRVDDLGAVLETVRMTVAPLRYGAGLKAKVIASLAAGVPCVCSPAAAEGFDFPPDLRSLVAGNDGAAVQAILRLHRDHGYHDAMSNLAVAYARAAFSEARLDQAMGEAAGKVGVDGSRMTA